MIRTESFSSISAFNQCPKRYWYQYIEKIEREENEALRGGKRVHEKIALGEKDDETSFAFEHKRKHAKVAIKELLKRNLFMNQEEFFFEQEESPVAYLENFSLTGYDNPKAIYHGWVDYIRLYVDKKTLRSSILKGREPNFDDHVTRIRLIDWKTGKSKGDKRQLETYALYYFKKYSIREIECSFVYQTMKPAIWKMKRGDVPDTQEWILKNIKKIRSCKEFYPSGVMCSWCGFEKKCKGLNKLEEGLNQPFSL